VSVLNSAITMNIALDGESPYDNADLFRYLQRHMSVMKSSSLRDWYSVTCNDEKSECGNYAGQSNAVFYTTDGMRFEFHLSNGANPVSNSGFKLHESDGQVCVHTYNTGAGDACGGCGSVGLGINANDTTKRPCAILVDVNGDKKPTPKNANCKSTDCQQQNKYYVPNINSKLVRDTFVILITDEKAIPYGVTAQKAMYNSQTASN
ncbi:MAG: hypothetical protein Q4F80_09455, partial [bacterium]|nr:hypothetical protein [bacterium]